MHKVGRFLPWRSKNVVRIVRLQGMLATRPRALNIQRVEKHLVRAFDTKKVKPKTVCLEINSVGGSAVQSNLIYQRIRNLSEENDIPVLSFAEDVAASGGYWLAVAGDEIFVDPNTMIGSIGVMSGKFGMMEAIKKLGLEWRVVTAGENKIRMDPFSPQKQEDVDWTKNLLAQLHANFIDVVKERRPKLDVSHATVFTGDVFTGKDAIPIGLADGICSDLKTLCIERYGKDVKFERCEPREGFLSKLGSVQSGVKVDFNVEDMLDAFAVKQLEGKYGI